MVPWSPLSSPTAISAPQYRRHADGKAGRTAMNDWMLQFLPSTLVQMRWDLVMAGIVGAAIVAIYQIYAYNRSIKYVANDAAKAGEAAVEWLKLIRQDTVGVFLLLAVNNMLLAAIVAILVFR
jgi:hypothetical protein